MHHSDSSHAKTLAFLSGKKLILLDIDGTIVPNHNSQEVPENVRRGLEKINGLGIQFALITNQGGPACRDAHWNRNDDLSLKREYPTVEEVKDRISTIASQVQQAVNKPIKIFVSWMYRDKTGNLYYPNGMGSNDSPPAWRKPEPGMVFAAMEHFECEPNEVVVIGDSGDDWQAAEAAGVDSMSAHSLQELGREHYELEIHLGNLYTTFQDHELAGLDELATRQAIQGSLERIYEHYAYIESVKITFNDDVEIEIYPEHLIDDSAVSGPIYDLFINYEWLRYVSPQAHANALAYAGDANVRATLPGTISRAYSLTAAEASKLIAQAEPPNLASRNRQKFLEARYQIRRLINSLESLLSNDELAVLIAAEAMLEAKAGGK